MILSRATMIGLSVLLSTIAYAGQSSQDKMVTLLPKQTYAAGTFTSPSVNMASWRLIRIELLNTPAEWAAQSASITITVYCSLDKGATYRMWQRAVFVGGILGSKGDGLPATGMSFPHQTMPPMECYGTVERSASIFFGLQVTDVR